MNILTLRDMLLVMYKDRNQSLLDLDIIKRDATKLVSICDNEGVITEGGIAFVVDDVARRVLD